MASAVLPKLTIVKATYSKNTQNDVTQKLRDIIAKNGGNLILDAKTDFNQLFGDPEPRVDKLFHVVYTYGPYGAQRSMTHAEKHVDIYLPALEIKQGQVLTVNVIKAVGLRDTRTIGKQNPYAKLTTGSESFKTKAHEKGGTDPVWNQSFIFNLDGKDQFMHVVVYDKETITDDTIARFDIPLATLAAATGEVAYNLVHPNDFKKSAGAIVLSCEFRDPNAPNVPPPAAAQPAPAPVQQQPQVVYQQPQPQVVYVQQPPQPQVVYQQPQVVYQQPQVVYQQPQVVYQQPAVQQPQVVYQAPVVQQPQMKQPEPAPAPYVPSYAPAAAATVHWPNIASGTAGVSDAAWTGSQHQRFRYDAASGAIETFDGRLLDIENGSRERGARIIAWPKKAGLALGPNQQWDYKNGYFVTRQGTGFAFAVEGGVDYVKNDGNLIMWTQDGTANQLWDLDEYGFIRSRRDPNIVVTLMPPHGVQGGGVIKTYQVQVQVKQVIWPNIILGAGGISAQRWAASQHQRYRYDAWTGFIETFDGRVLDVENGNKAMGAKLIAYPRGTVGEALNQKWDYKNGYFVTRMGTNYAFAVEGGADYVKDGANLIMWTQDGTANQLWDLDEYGFIRSRANRDQVLTVTYPHHTQGVSYIKMYSEHKS